MVCAQNCCIIKYVSVGFHSVILCNNTLLVLNDAQQIGVMGGGE